MGIKKLIRMDERKQREYFEEIARGNIERHLGDVAEESADSIYDEAWTLAHDALVDAGCPLEYQGEIARSVAQCYAQP
jgi:hypothetical protein